MERRRGRERGAAAGPYRRQRARSRAIHFGFRRDAQGRGDFASRLVAPGGMDGNLPSGLPARTASRATPRSAARCRRSRSSAESRAGATVYPVPPRLAPFPAAVAKSWSDQRITVMYVVASVLQMLLSRGNLAALDFSALRIIMIGGEHLPAQRLSELMRLLPHVRFFVSYARTEAKLRSLHEVKFPPEEIDTRTIGKTAADTRLLVLDEDEKPVADGAIGELWIAGPVPDARLLRTSRDDRGGHAHRHAQRRMTACSRAAREISCVGTRMERSSCSAVPINRSKCAATGLKLAEIEIRALSSSCGSGSGCDRRPRSGDRQSAESDCGVEGRFGCRRTSAARSLRGGTAPLHGARG